MAIAIPENEDNEASAWQLERDYNKIAFLTVAIATSIEYGTLYSYMFDYSHFLVLFSFSSFQDAYKLITGSRSHPAH